MVAINGGASLQLTHSGGVRLEVGDGAEKEVYVSGRDAPSW